MLTIDIQYHKKAYHDEIMFYYNNSKHYFGIILVKNEIRVKILA